MQLLRRLSLTLLYMSIMTLVACGGGDLTGDNDDDDDDGTTADLVLTVIKSDGELSAANDITVIATVLDNGSPVANKTVTFTLAVEDSATLDPVAGTATTDADGNASITVKVTNIEGSVNVIATYGDATNNVSFDSAGDGTEVVEGEPETSSLRLFASTQLLPSSGAEIIILSAIAKDENNNLLEGVTISFASDSGALALYVDDDGQSSTVTGADGKVSMTLSTEAEPSNRTITVVATSGSITDTVDVEVVGTSLSLTGSASLAINDETTYIVNLVDSDGNGIANTAVAVSLSGTSTSGSVADITIPASVTTDSEGQATLAVTGTSGGMNSIVVSALNTSASQDVAVQADSFLFTNFTNGEDFVNPSTDPVVPDVALTQTAEVTLTWLREGAAVADGTPVTFTTTRGVLSADSATTVDGKVTVTLTSSDAGIALVTLVGSDSVDGTAIELTNQLEFEFFADTAATITAQASPSSIGPDGQTSTISVVVYDDSGNLVKNKTIKFLLTDTSGGSIFPATAVTDSSGSASTVYTSNSTSAKDGVAIKAVVEDTLAVTDTAALTVSERELFITLGTGNQLEEPNTTNYIKEYSVFVTDVNSKAVENVELTVSAIPENYYKGFWIEMYDGDDFVAWVTAGYNSTITSRLATTACVNEDSILAGSTEAFNGLLDVGEDVNDDGELTPGNVVSLSGTFITDSDGHSVISINYSQSYGNWVDIKLVVSGKVTGSEGSTQTIFKLPVLASDVIQEDISPPQQGIKGRGPFGVAPDCSIQISDDPDNNVD